MCSCDRIPQNRNYCDVRAEEEDTARRRIPGRPLTLLTVTFFCLLLPSLIKGKPIKTETNTGAMLYLSQYGWLEKSNMKPGSAALVDIRGAIREFQAFAGLNQTGDLDEETVKLMGMPRCGVKDKIGHDAKRKKRYILQGSRWKVDKLTYKITKYPSRLTRSEVDSEVENAFRVWEMNTNLTFEKSSSSKVHIEVQFQKADHGDGDPFDGEGGTLAHAYFPVYGGDAHFDDEEKWSVKTYKGTNLFQVAAHEFGHSLGLSHSDVRTALMAPFYRGYQASFKLDQDDIYAIQKLYGKKEAAPPPKKIPYTPPVRLPPSGSKTPLTPPKSTEICKDPKIDAITTMGDGSTYVFKGPHYYKLTDTGIEDGYPKRIRDDFGIPGFLDAAFTWTNDKTYFFKGSEYWRFTSQKLDSGYPKPITDGFEGIPPNIDAVFLWSGNGKIYFFKGDEYYKFDPSRRPPVAAGYPKKISNWEGIPNNIHAALQYSNGNTYFFKDNNYWRFNDRNFAVDEATPPFPRSISTWWFGCGGDKGTSAMKTGNTEESVPSFFASDEDSGGGGRRSTGFSSITSLTHLRRLPILLLLLLFSQSLHLGT